MSVSTLENLSTLRELDRLNKWQQRMNDAEADLRDYFLAAMARPLERPALFAKRRDGKQATGLDVFMDAVDYDDFMERTAQLLCDMAHGKHRQADAMELLEDMATKYASQYVEWDE